MPAAHQLHASPAASTAFVMRACSGTQVAEVAQVQIARACTYALHIRQVNIDPTKASIGVPR